MADTSRSLHTGGPTAGGDGFDELDDLFIDDPNDPFSENYKPHVKEKTAKEKYNEKKEAERAGQGLGIDEEVEVTKKPRAPRVKLDEDRLLGENGIPKLRKRAKHLKFKGKGHEYSDIAKLLSVYQLWLDDLFPKARFQDALGMVEKMGHKKRMQMMRMEWINDGKPGYNNKDPEDSLFEDPALPPRGDDGREKTAPRIAPVFEKRNSERPKTPDVDMDMNDIYDATPKAVTQRPAEVTHVDSLLGGTTQSIFGPKATAPAAGDGPNEDELDALMAEEEMLEATSANVQVKPAPTKLVAPRDDFEDEMEAMAEMDQMW